MSLNKVMLIGNVGMEPEVRYTDNSSQNKVARIRLATTERFTDRSGESRENTEWHTVVCWSRNADVVERFVHKGTQLYVEGRIQTREWTDQTGNKRYSTEIRCDNLQLLGKRPDGAAPAQGGAPAYNQGGAPAYGQNAPQAPAYQQRPAAPTYPQQAPVAPQAPQAPAAQPFGAEQDDDNLPF